MLELQLELKVKVLAQGHNHGSFAVLVFKHMTIRSVSHTQHTTIQCTQQNSQRESDTVEVWFNTEGVNYIRELVSSRSVVESTSAESKPELSRVHVQLWVTVALKCKTQ